MRGSFTSASELGSRPTQEDRWVAAEVAGGLVLAVLDGHGGVEAAQRARDALLPVLEQSLLRHSSQPGKALRDCVAQLAKQTDELHSGSTLSLVYLPANDDRLYGAVLGDSPIAVLNGAGEMVLGANHNVRTNTAERAAALARGALFSGGYILDGAEPGLGLQMARALGDRPLARVLSREPEIFEAELGPRSVVMVATDGVLAAFDGSEAQQLSGYLAKIQAGAEAFDIAKEALKSDSGDNVTVLVWRAGSTSRSSSRRQNT